MDEAGTAHPPSTPARRKNPRLHFESENYAFTLRLHLQPHYEEPAHLEEAVNALESLFRFALTEISYDHEDGRRCYILRRAQGRPLPSDLDSMHEQRYCFSQDANLDRLVQVDEQLTQDGMRRLLQVTQKYLLNIHRLPIVEVRHAGSTIGRARPSGQRFRKRRRASLFTLPHQGEQGSPIEAIMRDALQKAGIAAGQQVPVYHEGRLLTVLDFLVETGKLAIYCDGYEYHYDRESVIKDRTQDRVLQFLGYTVLRYTGSEIVGGIDRCIHGIRLFVLKAQREAARVEQASSGSTATADAPS